MERSFLDNLSDGVSIRSQDRMSDDTDFLVGHNISFSNLNDSYIDAKSSTTTDLIYQNELNDAEIFASSCQIKVKTASKDENELSPTKENSAKIMPGNHAADRFDGDEKRKQESHMTGYNGDQRVTNEEEVDFAKKKHLVHSSPQKSEEVDQKKSRVINQNVNNEMSKSWDEFKNSKESMNTSASNWKYRSTHNSSDEDASISRGLNTKAPSLLSDSFTEYDPKVKEGEELLAKLLGRVTLTDSLKSNTTTSKETSHSNKGPEEDASWRDPPLVSRSGQVVNKVSGRKLYDQTMTAYRGSTGGGQDARTSDGRSRDEVTSPYSERSGHSKASIGSLPRRSSHDVHESHSSHSSRRGNDFASYDGSNNSHGDKASIHSKEAELTRRTATGEQRHRQLESPGRSLASTGDEKQGSSPSISDRKRGSNGSVGGEYTKEYVKGSRQFQNYEGEVRDRSRSSSLEKPLHQQLLKTVSSEIATSTPQKNNWPLSPIRKAADLKIEESEALIAKNERKLKEIQLLIEQETMRRDAICDEKSSSEDALVQIKKNISSLEQLAEEHKKQTVCTRTELMGLEQKRDECQRNLSKVVEELRKQKIELESLPEELKGSNISAKIAMLQDEREELKRECRILREKCKDNDHISSTNVDLMKKMRTLQEQLYNEQDSSRDKLRNLREELENEKRKAVESNIEQMSSLRKIREETMDAKKSELDAAIERIEKEKQSEMESIKERCSREVKTLHRKIEELEDENQRINKSSSERVSKLQEHSEINHKREIENVIKRFRSDKQNEMAILNQRHNREVEEMKLEIKTKQSDIENLQTLLNQQADSTRLLGEKLRKESKEQICLAVEKERESRLEELRKTELELEKVREERDALSSESNTELINKEGENERLRNVINKLKKELEDARQDNYEAREEKFQAISKTRSSMKEEVEKLRTKLREMERDEQMTLLELNEEFMKTTTVTGTSYPSVKRNYSFDTEDGNRISEALGILRSSNNDLRKLVITYKRKFEDSRVSEESFNQTNRSDFDSTKEKSIKSEKNGTPNRAVTPDRSRTPERSHTPERTHTPERARSPDSLRGSLNGSNDESRSARILKHLQSRVRQLREGNESMKKGFGGDEGEHDIDNRSRPQTPEQIGDASFSNSSADAQKLESALRSAEDQAQKYAGLLSQKMAENTKLQKMLTQASKENIKLERLHSILQHKVATSGLSV